MNDLLSKLQSLQRYAQETEYYMCHGDLHSNFKWEESPNGNWVKWKDIETILKEHPTEKDKRHDIQSTS